MSDFHTSTIQFMEGKDKAKLKLTMSTSQRKLSEGGARAPAAPQPNGSAKHQPLSSPSRPPEPNSLPRPLARTVHIPSRGQIQEVIVICAFVIISILYLIVRQKVIEYLH